MPRLATLGVLSKVAPLTAGLPFESVLHVNGSEAQLRVRAGAQYNLTLSHDPQFCEQ